MTRRLVCIEAKVPGMTCSTSRAANHQTRRSDGALRVEGSLTATSTQQGKPVPPPSDGNHVTTMCERLFHACVVWSNHPDLTLINWCWIAAV